ncbi:cation-transporting P-type ATPase, partial [Nocardioides guangzhouensis]
MSQVGVRPGSPAGLDALAVAEELGVDVARGLSADEAARRLAEHGPNQ